MKAKKNEIREDSPYTGNGQGVYPHNMSAGVMNGSNSRDSRQTMAEQLGGLNPGISDEDITNSALRPLRGDNPRTPSSLEDEPEQPVVGEELSPEVKRLLAEAVKWESVVDMFKHKERNTGMEKMYNEAVSMEEKITSCIGVTLLWGNERTLKCLSSELKEAIDKEIKDLNSEIFGEDGEVEVVKAKNGAISTNHNPGPLGRLINRG